MPSRNLYKCKQVACSVVVLSAFLYYTLLLLVYFLIPFCILMLLLPIYYFIPNFFLY